VTTSFPFVTRSMLLNVLLLFSTFAFAAKDKVTIQGNIGAITPPAEFQVGDETIVCGPETILTLKYDTKAVRLPFEAEAIHSGIKVTVNGKRDPVSKQIRASSVVAIVYERLVDEISGTALIEKPLSMAQTNAGWSGIIFADGRKIKFTRFTKLEFVANKSERAQAPGGPSSSIKSLSEVGPNVFVSYKGLPFQNGAIIAEELVFVRNEDSPAKLKLRQEYEPQIVEPDYSAGTPGKLVVKPLNELSIASNRVLLAKSPGELPIIPNKALQDTVNEVGVRLVPAFQKSLPGADPLKINFRFYVVETDKFALHAVPSGVILVSVGMLSRLNNEAQLAAILAADMALVVQQGIYSLTARAKTENIATFGSLGALLASSAAPPMVLPGEVLILHSAASSERLVISIRQAGRLALEYMLDAGYDPREAEKAFTSLGKKSKTDPRLRQGEREYYEIMAAATRDQLKDAYRDVNFGELKTNTEEYERLHTQFRATTN